MNLIQAGQQLTMSSREIAGLLEKQHGNIKISAERLADKGVIGTFAVQEFEHNGNIYTEYLFNKRDSLILVAQNCPEFTARIVDRWQELEAKQARPAELSRMDILKLAMESEQARIEAEGKLAIAAPKAEFVDRYVQAETGSMGVRQVCKVLGAKQNEFTDWMLARGFMYRQTPGAPLTPKAEHIHNGRFEAKTGVAEHGENSHAYVHYKFTAKGVEWIAGEWAKFKIKSVQAIQ